MASPLSSLSKSIAAIPAIFSKCAVSTLRLSRKQLRGSRVAGFKSRLQFCQFAQIFDAEMEMKNQNFQILEESSCTDSTGLILSIINVRHKLFSNVLLGDHKNWCKHLLLLKGLDKLLLINNRENKNGQFWRSCAPSFVVSSWFSSCQVAQSSVRDKPDMVYEIGELFELGIQLSYLLILLGLLGLGTFFVIRQVLVRRELDLSAKELQEQVRSGDATATGYFELGAVMLRRKVYPAATKYLQQAIEKWDRDDQDLAQVHNALGVSYVRDNKLDKGIAQFEAAVKLQPGYVTAWNNLGDAYEKKKNLKSALKAFEEVLLFDPNNKIARPRRDALRERVELYKGVPIKSEER